MTIKEYIEIIVLILLIIKIGINQKKNLYFKLDGAENSYSYRELVIFIIITLDLLFLDLNLVWILFLTAFTIVFSALKINNFKITRVNYSDLAFKLFNLSLILRSGEDLVSGLKEVSKDYKSYFSIVLNDILKDINSNLDFNTAIFKAANKYIDPAIRQVLIQLEVAYSSGSSISKIIEEIANSALDFQQDAIDREISKMPIKATLPLLLIFAGSLILMLTPALINLLEFTKEIVVK